MDSLGYVAGPKKHIWESYGKGPVASAGVGELARLSHQMPRGRTSDRYICRRWLVLGRGNMGTAHLGLCCVSNWMQIILLV